MEKGKSNDGSVVFEKGNLCMDPAQTAELNAEKKLGPSEEELMKDAGTAGAAFTQNTTAWD